MYVNKSMQYNCQMQTKSVQNVVNQFRVPTLLLKKIQDFSRTPGEIIQDLYGAHKCLHIRKNGEKHILTLFKVWSSAETIHSMQQSVVEC